MQWCEYFHCTWHTVGGVKLSSSEKKRRLERSDARDTSQAVDDVAREGAGGTGGNTSNTAPPVDLDPPPVANGGEIVLPQKQRIGSGVVKRGAKRARRKSGNPLPLFVVVGGPFRTVEHMHWLCNDNGQHGCFWLSSLV